MAHPTKKERHQSGLGLIYTFDEYLRPSLDTGGEEKVRRPRYCSFPLWGKAGMGAAPVFSDGLF